MLFIAANANVIVGIYEAYLYMLQQYLNRNEQPHQPLRAYVNVYM
jgi:hypothetical protein